MSPPTPPRAATIALTVLLLTPWTPLLFVAAALLARADDEPVPPPWEQRLVHRGEDVTKRIALVVDTSGSMLGRPFDHALLSVAFLLESPTDAFWLKVYNFASAGEEDVFDAADLPTLSEDEKDANGWIAMPNAEVVKAAREWLVKHGPEGSTHITPALARAFKENSEDDLSVVIVSDFDLGEYDDVLWETIGKLRETRPLPLHTLGVNPTGVRHTLPPPSLVPGAPPAGEDGRNRPYNLMLRFATETGGSCMVVTPPAPVEGPH